MNRVFLGGTCNESTWRSELIKDLNVNFYNPVVDDWNPQEEAKEKAKCIKFLYVLTPLATGFFSIAEVVHDAITIPADTVFCLLNEDTNPKTGEKVTWTPGQLKSLKAIENMFLRPYGAKCFDDLVAVADYLNEEMSDEP